MKLADYIRIEIEKGRLNFDIGLNRDITVDDRSPTRIRFKVRKVFKKVIK